MYDSQLSPFSARCRMVIYAKGLDIEIKEMPGAITPEEFVRLTPMHKVPTLTVGEAVIPESQVICDYLERMHPEPALTSSDDLVQAQIELLCRICDLYVMTPLGQLFGQVNPQSRDDARVEALVADLKKGLSWLDHYLGDGAYAIGDKLTLADCTIMPILFFVQQLGPMLGHDDLLADSAKVSNYFKVIQADEHAQRVMGEMATALQKWQKSQ
ncbi:MAG: glutathione S-transferase [Parvibaculaceae bacterium]|jgi:glutathione S-transferase